MKSSSGSPVNAATRSESVVFGTASLGVRAGPRKTPSALSSSRAVSSTRTAFSGLSNGNHGSDYDREFEKEQLEEEQRSCGSRWAARESNPVRRAWGLVVCLMVGYTATFFLYRLSFLEFHIAHPSVPEPTSWTLVWTVAEETVNVLFWLDLFSNFLFTFRDHHGREVCCLRRIAIRYLCGFFLIDLVACLPPDAFEALSNMIMGPSSWSGVNRGIRVLRLSRIWRLARLVKLSQVVKFFSIRSHLYIWQRFKNLRGVRILQFFASLLWIVHFLACGWYLCAAFHEDPAETWINRRYVNADQTRTVWEEKAFEQWIQSMYFVLTVFTTVGFGDMFPVTSGEIVFVSFMMLVGAIVHSIIISEVINIITTTDTVNMVARQQRELVDAFGSHTELDPATRMELKDWISANARSWLCQQYNREDMKRLIKGKYLPPWLLQKMPRGLFGGRLLRNSYFRIYSLVDRLPPQLPLLLALRSYSCHFQQGEVVYQAYDNPVSALLVLHGTLAFVGLPRSSGGVDAVLPKETAFNGDGMEVTDAFSGEDAGSKRTVRPSPYQLFSHNTYCGDIELFQGSGMRYCSLRCESPSSTVVVVPRREFLVIAEEFQAFAGDLIWLAQRRESHRHRLLAKLTRGHPYRTFAAITIQRLFRERCSRVPISENHRNHHHRHLAWAKQTMNRLWPHSATSTHQEAVEIRRPGTRRVLEDRADTPQAREPFADKWFETEDDQEGSPAPLHTMQIQGGASKNMTGTGRPPSFQDGEAGSSDLKAGTPHREVMKLHETVNALSHVVAVLSGDVKGLRDDVAGLRRDLKHGKRDTIAVIRSVKPEIVEDS